MTDIQNDLRREKTGGCLLFVVKLALAVGIYLVIGGALAWAPPHTIILLAVAAMVWYLIRQGAGRRFNLRSILAFMTGIAVIIAAAALMPEAMHSRLPRTINPQILVKLVDETTETSIPGADAVLTSRVAKKLTTQEQSSDSKGTAKFIAECNQSTQKSLLRTWTTYRTEGWLLQAKAPGYKPATKTLSDIVVDGDGGGPIELRMELEPLKE